MEDKEILETAIEGEIESYEFYERLVDAFEDVKNIAHALAKEERKHREMLESIYKKRYGEFVRRAGFYIYPELIPDRSLLSGSPDRRELISVAISAEGKAKDFYEHSYEETKEEIFMELARMEEKHRERLQSWYARSYPLS